MGKPPYVGVAGGCRAVVFNSRGTSDGPVTTAQFYSASFTGDTRAVMKHVEELYPNSLMLAAGWSLGANILVGTPIPYALIPCKILWHICCTNRGYVLNLRL